MMINERIGFGIKTTLLALILFSTFVSITGAQLGEIAGPLGFQVQVGHTQTLRWYLLNEGNQSVFVEITGPPQIQITSNVSQAANQITPTIYLNPSNGFVPSHGELAVNVTVFMPLNNTPDLTSWEAILSAEEFSNQTNPGGAVVFSGVAKITSISAIPSTTTTSTTTIVPTYIPQSSGNNNIPLIIGAIIVLAIVAYALTRKKKPMTKAQARRAKLLAAKAAIKGKKAKGATSEEQKLRAERDKLRKQIQALKKTKGAVRKSAKKKTRRRRR